MGYKKLDEVMELLTEELDGFNKSIDRLEKLTKNVDDIKIKADTSKIEHLLETHLKVSHHMHTQNQKAIQHLQDQITNSKVVSKVQLWLQYVIWLMSLIIIGYLVIKVMN
ncbi:hypothetical protein SAMN03097699_2367 [Flavobacteriaceae bacterium MAR_2010_188]|nr:hypothetical protein SAMN03097699_2367 [Flavobacteriaceae bacterium MAR_2010_188]